MLGRRHVYHVSPFASTPHRSSPGYAHSPPSPWSYEGFRKPENEKSYTIEIHLDQRPTGERAGLQRRLDVLDARLRRAEELEGARVRQPRQEEPRSEHEQRSDQP